MRIWIRRTRDFPALILAFWLASGLLLAQSTPQRSGRAKPSPAGKASGPTASPQPGPFALALGNGNSLDLLKAEGPQPALRTLDMAVCGNGLQGSVRYTTVRVAWNSGGGGGKFTVSGGMAMGGCLVSTSSTLSAFQPVPLTVYDYPAKPPACSLKTVSELEAREHRKVKACSEIAKSADSASVIAAEFNREGDSLLAALAFQTPASLRVYEMPATYDSVNGVGWRWALGGDDSLHLGSGAPFDCFLVLQHKMTNELIIGVKYAVEESAHFWALRSSGQRLIEISTASYAIPGQ